MKKIIKNDELNNKKRNINDLDIFKDYLKVILFRVRQIDQKLERLDRHIFKKELNDLVNDNVDHNINVKFKKQSMDSIDFKKSKDIYNGTSADYSELEKLSDLVSKSNFAASNFASNNIKNKKGQEKKNYLKRLDFFKNLPDQIINKIAIGVDEKKYSSGQTIFKENDPSGPMIIIKSGHVSIYKNIESKNCLIYTCGPGSCIGEMAFLNDSLRSATVIADEETNVLILKREEFEKLSVSDPKSANCILKSIVSILSLRIRQSHSHYAYDFKIKIHTEMFRLKRMGEDIIELIKAINNL
jgi:CRP-like cAMP-binding protein